MRIVGKVRWFDLIRGFGVIGRGLGETDCFVRHSSMRGTALHALATGEPVEFRVVQGGAGAVAHDVVRVGTGTLVRVDPE